ncbi:MAG: hypothetical protein LHW49_09050 [Candidatus Cloacimonetes bacterium]|nr:hypothetical protein [Candidatus Cloacimonadota bacterium]MDD2650304.1 hypothetical protein [Candidatus Cloacimonadota bacterium]MDD3501307.1 hypothetical protein [Candidatus Cloacimonadota bacterium]
MKVITKLTSLALLLTFLILAACTPPPPPVSKDQLSKAEEMAINAETRAAELAKEKVVIEQEVQERNDKLSTLKQMEKEME